MKRRRAAGASLLGVILLLAGSAPIVTPHSPVQQFAGFENAPPMLPRLRGEDGVRAPFVRPGRSDGQQFRLASDSQPPTRS